jgi:hypothetical protein
MLEPAPSEREQLSARLELIENLRSLLDDLSKRFGRRKAQLENFGTKSVGLIGYSIFREAFIHMSTLNVVTAELILEFIKFLEKGPLCRSRISFEMETVMNKQTASDLRDCVIVMGVNEWDQYRKLALTLVSKGAKLSGLDIPVTVAELIDAVKDIAETGGVQNDEEHKTAKFLLEIEFFMMLSLPSALFAAASVHIRTAHDSTGNSDTEADVKAAREYVTEHLLTVRTMFEKVKVKPLLRFPETGMWFENLNT